MWQDWPQSCKLQELFCCCLWCLLSCKEAPHWPWPDGEHGLPSFWRWVPWDWGDLHARRICGACWWMGDKGARPVHPRPRSLIIPCWQRVHLAISEMVGSSGIPHEHHLLQEVQQIFSFWWWCWWTCPLDGWVARALRQHFRSNAVLHRVRSHPNVAWTPSSRTTWCCSGFWKWQDAHPWWPMDRDRTWQAGCDASATCCNLQLHRGLREPAVRPQSQGWWPRWCMLSARLFARSTCCWALRGNDLRGPIHWRRLWEWVRWCWDLCECGWAGPWGALSCPWADRTHSMLNVEDLVMDSGSTGWNLQESSPTCLWSSMPTSPTKEAHLGSLQWHWTFRRTSWTPWCRCDAFWTQQWMGLLQISTSKTFDGTGLWAWAGWDLHVSQVHTLVSHAGHQHALWSWLGWTLGASWLRPWDPSEVLQEAVLVSGETWSSCTHWTSTPQCCLGNTSLCQTSRWTHNFWSMWIWLHDHSWWWWSTNHENHLHSDHKTCDVSHHVQTMLRQPSTCPTWRWKPLQEGWELPMRACLEFSSCPSWRWGFVGTGLCCSTRRRSSRADWSSSKTWHKAWLWSGAHCLPPPSKPWASEKGHFGPHAAGQECRPKGHRCSRSPWVPLLQQVFFQETISSSSCRASHGLQWAASGRHLVVWFELSWAWCPFWQSFQAEDWHVGHGWFCNSLHGCAIHSWWIKQATPSWKQLNVNGFATLALRSSCALMNGLDGAVTLWCNGLATTT